MNFSSNRKSVKADDQRNSSWCCRPNDQQVRQKYDQPCAAFRAGPKIVPIHKWHPDK
jgi:hypothetical protein